MRSLVSFDTNLVRNLFENKINGEIICDRFVDFSWNGPFYSSNLSKFEFEISINPRFFSSSTLHSQVIVFLCENVKRDDRNQIVARKEKRENGGF